MAFQCEVSHFQDDLDKLCNDKLFMQIPCDCSAFYVCQTGDIQWCPERTIFNPCSKTSGFLDCFSSHLPRLGAGQ